MNTNHTIIKIKSIANAFNADSTEYPLQRICGYISVKDFVKLMSVAENKVNPRSAKINTVVKQICDTLECSPELFWIKSKGILLATKNCIPLERSRVRITLGEHDYEGIMDGGHNTLAIAKYIIETISQVTVKDWGNCKEYWTDNYQLIESSVEEEMKNGDKFNFIIPVEIVAPLNESLPGVSPDDAMRSEQFYIDNLPDICSARNTNVQLKETAQSKQRGLYDLLMAHTPRSAKIQWKNGEGDGVKPEDVVALACLPLMALIEQGALQLSTSVKLSPVNLYSSKGKCVDFYKKVMTDPAVSSQNKGKYTVHNKSVISALKLVNEIILFYDRLYMMFPDIYNSVAGCSFGRISSVKKDKKKNFIPSYPHFGTIAEKSDKTYPDGFIYPLIWGVLFLMEYNKETETLKWRVSPDSLTVEDFKKDGDQETYVSLIKALNWDPQKIGKNQLSYNTASDFYKKLLMRF